MVSSIIKTYKQCNNHTLFCPALYTLLHETHNCTGCSKPNT
ncbi:unnamed protein product [Ixodes pacificus]